MGSLEASRDMETGHEASRVAPVPGPMVEQGTRAAMVDPGPRAAMAGRGDRGHSYIPLPPPTFFYLGSHN